MSNDWDYDEEEAVASNGTYFKADELIGHLLIIWATKYQGPGEAPTEFNANGDAVVCDIVDLDQADENGLPGLLSVGTRFFQARLIRDLKTRVGRPPVLAIMTQGTATKGRPPYELVLVHTDPDCKVRANEWRSRNPDFAPSAFGPTAGKVEEAKRQAAPATKAQPQIPAANAGVLERLKQQAASAQRQATNLQQAIGQQSEKPPF